MRALLVWIAMLSWGATARAEEPPPAASAGPRKLGLRELLAAARRFPSVEAARHARDAASARRDEVARSWVPRLELRASGGPIAEIRCEPTPDDCAATDPDEIRVGLDGAFVRLEADLIAPLVAFGGKLDAAKRAASHAERAHSFLIEVAEEDAVAHAARAYFGVKAARELLAMLDEGAAHLERELTRIDEDLNKGAGGAVETDRYRMKVVRSEIEARVAEARRAEALALAGVRAISGGDDEVDDAPLEALALPGAIRGSLDDDDPAAADERAPESLAAEEGAAAAHALADLEAARLWPDLVLVGRAAFARGTGDDPDHAYADDPLHETTGTVVFAVRWAIDLGGHPARVRAARAEAARAASTARAALRWSALERRRARAVLVEARDRLRAAETGHVAARAWLVSTVQSADAGLAEPRDLAEALTAYFTVKARLIQARFDWNLAVIDHLRRAGVDLESAIPH